MLKSLSKFILEVLPYVMSGLIAAVVVPGFLISQFHGSAQARLGNVGNSSANALELLRDHHAALGR